LTGRLERRPWVRPSELVITRTLGRGPQGVVVASPGAAVVAAVATLVADSAFFLGSKHTLEMSSLSPLAFGAGGAGEGGRRSRRGRKTTLKAKTLRRMLKKKGLKTTGKKATLMKRLHLRGGKMVKATQADVEAGKAKAVGEEFDDGVKEEGEGEGVGGRRRRRRTRKFFGMY